MSRHHIHGSFSPAHPLLPACKVVFFIVPLLLLIGCTKKVEKPPVPRPVFAMQLQGADEMMERTFPGRARAAREVNRSFRVSGPLITFPVDVGDEVKQGDVLARIDPQDFETVLRTLEGQLEREQANKVRAQADFRRIENVFKADPGATSEAAVDRARQLRDSAAASVRSIESSVQNARDQLSYTYLRAPFDGMIVETYVENFETVVARQPILRLLDSSQLEFVIDVPESLISYSRYVEKAEIVFDAFPETPISATISEISKEASQATRTYPVTLLMTQPEGVEILPGMAGEAEIVARLPDDVVQTGNELPATAIFAGDDLSTNFVWVVDPDSYRISRKEVKVGALTKHGVRIHSGVNTGDWVVIKGVNSLNEGQEVKILPTGERRGS